jgi:FtsH Extracellular
MWGKKRREQSPNIGPLEPGPTENKTPAGWHPQWGRIVWYALLALMALWLWQETLPSVAYRTIPYSEFKQRLAEGEVVECVVASDEIEGKIKTGGKTASATQVEAATHVEKGKAPVAPGAAGAAGQAKSNKAEAFVFRTLSSCRSTSARCGAPAAAEHRHDLATIVW